MERSIWTEQIRVPRDKAENDRQADREHPDRSGERATPPKPGEPRLEFRHRDVGRASHHPQFVHVLLLHEQVAQRVRRFGWRPEVKPGRHTQTRRQKAEGNPVDAPRVHLAIRYVAPPRTQRHSLRAVANGHAAGGSAGFSGSAADGGEPEGCEVAAPTGRSREPSRRKRDASVAPTRLRFTGAFSAAGVDEEEGLVMRADTIPQGTPLPSAGRPICFCGTFRDAG